MNDSSITLVVCGKTNTLRLKIPDGMSARDALDTTDMRVRAACGGTGMCGACTVRWVTGKVNPHTVAEYNKLTPGDRAAGIRLACQLRFESDGEIWIDDPAPPSEWKSILPENLSPAPGQMPELEKHIYGVAVDLGTTHIRVALWDRKRGRRIATRRGPNPQNVFGADVLNRLDAAFATPERPEKLAQLARNAIIHAIRDILARDVGEVRPMLAEIGQITIVGNTAMLALLTGQGGKTLINPENWQVPIECTPCDVATWFGQWNLPHARISLPHPLAGFIGSDLIADLVATNLVGGISGSLLLDFGTNTEIALWNGQRLYVTSVPGGPAFEGVGIRNGMSAESGAISSVRYNNELSRFDYEVIGTETARGFCGSGLTDAVAVLLDAGILKPSGRFTGQSGSSFVLDAANQRTTITNNDVDAFQRAKAATAAAMEELLAIAGMDWCDIRRLCVCGAFGKHLNIGNAQQVGLLPSIPPEWIELHADATLAGCEHALLCHDGEKQFDELSKEAMTVNLSYSNYYDDRYINHLRLKPISPAFSGASHHD